MAGWLAGELKPASWFLDGFVAIVMYVLLCSHIPGLTMRHISPTMTRMTKTTRKEKSIASSLKIFKLGLRFNSNSNSNDNNNLFFATTSCGSCG